MTARARLVLGLLGIAGTAAVVRRDRVGPREVRAFQAVNRLPDVLHRPSWLVMQAGTIGAVPVAAAVAHVAGRPRTAGRMLLSGTSAWLLGKALKRVVQRPRPTALIPGTTCRGREATGMGYVSGHAAVAVALTSAALPQLPPRPRRAILAVAPVVGVTRMYVGAHLPLDVLGGAALGLATDSAVALASRRVGFDARRGRPWLAAGRRQP